MSMVPFYIYGGEFCPQLLLATKNSLILKYFVRILNAVKNVLSLPETSVKTPICFNHSFDSDGLTKSIVPGGRKV